MLTEFSPRQLSDPVIAEADGILRSCVHCGFCTATCPTFHLLGDELDSPRGRIVLIKEMHENGGVPGSTVVKHLDRCLTCLSCMTTCPSGVDYMHLVEGARNRIEDYPEARPLRQRLVRRLLRGLLTNRRLFHLSMRLAALARPLAPFLPGLPRRLLTKAPRLSPPAPASAVYPAVGHCRARVALLTGCAQSVVGGEINRAAIRLLARHGAEVVVSDVPCCGALDSHLGAAVAARGRAATAVRRWWRETAAGGGAGLDAVVITTSGCGTSVKDYGHLLAGDPELAEPARQIAALTVDVSEWMDRVGLLPPAHPPGGRVAYHAACSLQHGQRQRKAAPALLRAAGFDTLDVADGHFCCGSAGTYNILQPVLADGLKSKKQDNIRVLAADMVATGNLGCILQLQDGLELPVLHTLQLLDWATGGPKPQGVT
jgi:glycolate oxidase iron-sulfur subunit